MAKTSPDLKSDKMSYPHLYLSFRSIMIKARNAVIPLAITMLGLSICIP